MLKIGSVSSRFPPVNEDYIKKVNEKYAAFKRDARSKNISDKMHKVLSSMHVKTKEKDDEKER